jgi:hypothetical protein
MKILGILYFTIALINLSVPAFSQVRALSSTDSTEVISILNKELHQYSDHHDRPRWVKKLERKSATFNKPKYRNIETPEIDFMNIMSGLYERVFVCGYSDNDCKSGFYEMQMARGGCYAVFYFHENRRMVILSFPTPSPKEFVCMPPSDLKVEYTKDNINRVVFVKQK